MGNSKIEDLIELTSVADADVLPIVDDTTGTPVTKKITKKNLVKNIVNDDLSATANIAQSKIANLTTDLSSKAPIASPTFTGTVTTAALDVAGNNIDNIQNLIHDISTTTATLDFSGDQVQTISISANTTFTTSNLAAGKSKTIKITTDGTLRTLTFPAWKFVGTKPTDQAASKVGILTLTSFGTTDADCVAAYAVEE